MTSFTDAVQKSITIALKEPPICDDCSRTLAEEFVILAANRLEAADSSVCDCDNPTPTFPTTHTCDCTAVITAARLLEGLCPTLHAEQCIACQ